LEGVGLLSENWRYYPEGSFASSILGFVNNEGNGNYGLEEELDDSLMGVPGQMKADTDSSGVRIAFGKNVLKEPIDGTDVYLTIDRYVQQQAEKVLSETVKKFSAASGTVVVMEPNTGKILAIANNPTFDPNKFNEVKDYDLFKNKSVTDSYEPGSIFKVITMAAGLDAGKITPDTKFEDIGKLVLNGNTIMNSDKKAHGTCTMTYVLEQSLNTGSSWVEQQLGKDKFYEYVKKFNFGNLTGIDLPGEANGYVNKPEQLNDHGYATMSFGQSISTTPIQMLTAFSAIANKGKMMQPYVVADTVDVKGKKNETKPKELGQVISEQASNDLIKMMVSVVEKGHGTQAKVTGYKVAGKTGTAQIVRKDGLGYESGKNIGSFIGFAPAEDANFVVLAKIDEPKNVAWAESTAAPVVGQMLDFLLKFYQIPPTEKM
jgi:cell division protein FtsI/penicillin-binding protein 2